MKAVLKRKPNLGREISEVQKSTPRALKNVAKYGSDLDLYKFAPAYETGKLPVSMGHEFSGGLFETGWTLWILRLVIELYLKPWFSVENFLFAGFGRQISARILRARLN